MAGKKVSTKPPKEAKLPNPKTGKVESPFQKRKKGQR